MICRGGFRRRDGDKTVMKCWKELEVPPQLPICQNDLRYGPDNMLWEWKLHSKRIPLCWFCYAQERKEMPKRTSVWGDIRLETEHYEVDKLIDVEDSTIRCPECGCQYNGNSQYCSRRCTYKNI